jgi:hypothetical protein
MYDAYGAWSYDRAQDNYDSVSKTGQLRQTDLTPYMGKEVLVHLRYSTQGDVNAINCQPFTSDQLIFAHNGVVSEFVSDVYSDTHLIYQILNRGLKNKTLSWDDIPKFLQTWGAGNRFVAINPNNGKKHFVGAWPAQTGLGQDNPAEMVTHLPYTPTCNTYLPHERKAFFKGEASMQSNASKIAVSDKTAKTLPAAVSKIENTMKSRHEKDLEDLLLLLEGGSFDVADAAQRALVKRVSETYKRLDLASFQTSEDEMGVLLLELKTEIKAFHIRSSLTFKAYYEQLLTLAENFEFDCEEPKHLAAYNYIEKLMDDFELQVALFPVDDEIHEAYDTLSELVCCFRAAKLHLEDKSELAALSLEFIAANKVVQDWRGIEKDNKMISAITQALKTATTSV